MVGAVYKYGLIPEVKTIPRGAGNAERGRMYRPVPR